MADVEIRVGRNSSYHIKGNFKLYDHKGNEIAFEGDEIFLCRCGQSGDKPFCDGTHRSCKFDGTFNARHVPQVSAS
jgi:CDGSH-type Zn-finger protein